MTSVWKYLCCCCCDATDDKRFSGNSRYKRHKSKKNTWTRRKLLEADDTNCIPGDQIAYQMRSFSDHPIQAYDEDRDVDFVDQILDQMTIKKRPTVQGVFDAPDENRNAKRNVSQTTFPWMDDGFVPNGRPGTRLGISSVHLNSKRIEEKNNVANDAVDNVKHSDKSERTFIPGQQQNQRNNQQIYRNNYQLMKTNSNHPDLIQSGQAIRNNIVTAPKLTPLKKQTPVRHVVSVNSGSKPMVFKESASDVGVRRIKSSGHQPRQYVIPKLDNYSNVVGLKFHKDSNSDIGHYRPKPQVALHNVSAATDGGVNYSSEVTLRQHSSFDESSDISLKHPSVPGMLSSKGVKYERIKVGKGKLQNRQSQHLPESMYGYVPKVVQEVRASSALEGRKIDDYFVKLFQDRKEDKFGLLELSDEENEDVPVIITTVGSIEDLTKDRTSHMKEQASHTTQKFQPVSTNTHQKLPVHVNSTFTPKPVAKTLNLNGKENANGSGRLHTNGDKLEDKHDQVIMIDFPPNLDKDKNKTGINAKLQQVTIPPPPSSKNVNKLNEGTRSSTSEVLY